MKKLGLCIVYNNNNYGSMLQSYATQMMLKKKGIKFEVIRYKKVKTPLFVIKSIPRLLNPIIWSDKYLIIQKKLQLRKHKELNELNAVRTSMFEQFREKNFTNFAEVSIGYSELIKDSKKYDAFLVGSDQLWSPSGLPTNFYNLKFVDDNTPKISYASSFGVKKIPFYQRRRTRAYLERIENISVRENAGKEIVKELTGRDVPVVVDPTLLFTRAEWEELVPPKRIVNEPYIFAYFLGPNGMHREEVKKLAQELHMKIVALRHQDQFVKADETFGDIAPYNVGPEEFVNLIRYADYVCTDSFHGSVISIIHHRQFVTFNRYDESAIDSKNSRIDSLLENLHLTNQRFNNTLYEQLVSKIDYAIPDKNIESLRYASESYLDKTLLCVRE